MADASALRRILEAIPHREPFRFVDELLEAGPEGATGRYTFKDTEHFYRGHFPGLPITPGVILIETMAQCAVLPLGFFLMGLAESAPDTDQAFVLTDCRGDFLRPVYPGTTVTSRSELVFWKRSKLRARVTMLDASGVAVAEGEISGMGVSRA